MQLIGVTATDGADNVSNSYDGNNVVVSIDANTPVVNTVTSDATGVDTLSAEKQEMHFPQLGVWR